ncbi:MAG: helix-turn-helix transcriptional regulator [Rhodocyclaceae bacterium]|nr:helix-turn-helix transcriptional regulator [Rhodocyclaceae bacterium]
MPERRPTSLFGVRLRAAREAKGLAQDRLGVMIGIDEGCSSARISRYESGIHAPPYPTVQKMAAALGVPTAYLYCDDDRLADLLLKLGELSGSDLERVAAYIMDIRQGAVPG